MQKYLSFFVVLFSFFSLFGGWGEDLCEDQTCSGHGECQEDGENEWCVCDEGYIADGMECILGCDGVTCSGHGTCSVVSGAEVCTCEAGFYATGLSCILNEASTVDTLAILNSTDCYNTGNCHYRLIFATGAYDFTPALSSLYDIIINVLDSENVWHNYRKTVAQCVAEGVCDNVDAQYIDFWFQHNVSGNQYITAELLGNGDDAYDDMYHDVLIDYCYGVNCGTSGTCDGTSGYPVCSCEEGYVLRSGICEEGWFEDENLAAVVVELLQFKGYDIETETDIEPEMLEDIEMLALKGKNISSLVGIGHLSSLSVLDVSENNISDLSPLADCSELTVLNISGNPANDLNPLSGLPLVSLDISYSGVFDMQPLADMNTLEEIIFADRDNGKYGMLLHENFNVIDWLIDKNGTACMKGVYNSRTGDTVLVSNPDCSGGGICLNGLCLCNEGYYYENGDCHAVICNSQEHWDSDRHYCVSNRKDADCPQPPEKAVIVNKNQLEWNGTEYTIPSGRTTELCHRGDDGCENSICQWDCKTGYIWVKDRCVPENRTTREIPNSTYNQLILPNISRQDVALEPIPGVPSFAPVLKAEFYYNRKSHPTFSWYIDLVAGWYLSLPRVELNNHKAGDTFHSSYEWDHKTVYVYMPWGREEYSIETEKKCFDSDDSPVNCKELFGIDRLEIIYYPSAGQNLFSYIVLETSGDAYKTHPGSQNDRMDWWRITRYGEDGSVTEFSRNYDENEAVAPRPSFYNFMDYIPISKHTTRDKKETSFYYEWGKVERKDYFYHTIRSATIIDPLKRVIKIESSDPDLSDSETPSFGLMGQPYMSHKAVYTSLEGKIDISVGKANSEDEITGSLKKVVTYSNINGFSMDATIYKGEHTYRTDVYLKDEYPHWNPYANPYAIDKGVFHLNSYITDVSYQQYPLGILSGQTTWDINRYGYTERKLVANSTPEEYIVKTVKGRFYQAHQEPNSPKYSLSSSPHRTVTIYSHEKDGDSGKKRIVEDYFTDWLQPAKRVSCEREYQDNHENCNNISDAVTEEIKYNVSGSPIYFKNADGQVTVNLYDTTNEVNSVNYIVHFLSDPWHYSNAVDLNVTSSTPNPIRADNLHRFGTLACSATYSLDTNENFTEMLLNYVAFGARYNADWCRNTADHKATNYIWQRENNDDDDWEKPYDLKTVTYPDGKTRSFTYDYETTTPSGYIRNGKVWGETVSGSNNQNQLQTCYAYNNDYQLIKQGIGTAANCDYKKRFEFDTETGLLMTRDFLHDGTLFNLALSNDYVYDTMGRKIVERNSAGVSTVYVYDNLDRVVFTFFGCNVDPSAFENRVYTPYNFDGDDSAGVTGTGVAFSYTSGEFPYARYINLNACEYYRKYKYDKMSNLVETYFFEYWGVNENNQIVQLDSPKIIKQKTEYDQLGRAVRSCQSDILEQNNRCIETERDAFGNITKKEEKGLLRTLIFDQGGLPHFVNNTFSGESREITYDLRNRPLTVTVDGLLTEEYSYNNAAAGSYFCYDTIRNKYEDIDPLTTYKDRWGRAAKSVDPFGNNVEPHYNSTTWQTDYSKTYNGTTLTSFDAYEYDDLGRISTVKKVLFDPVSNTSNAAATSIDSIAAKEMVLEKSVSYDPVTGSVIAVEDSFGRATLKEYDSLNRVIKVENYDADNQLVSSVRTAYDAAGRISAEQNWTSAKTTVTEYDYDRMDRVVATCVKTTNVGESQNCLTSSCAFDNDDVKCSYQMYNTGGQVIWSADTESGGITNLLSFLNADLIVGNETVYDYNAFGEVVKTARRMTATGRGGGYTETQLYNSDAWITTNFSYDIFGRIAEKYDDNGAKTYYTYTANNLPATEKYCGSDDSDCDYPREVTYAYNSKRDLISETFEQSGNTLTLNYGRDDYGRISQKYTGTTSNDVYQTFTYNVRNLLETAKSVDPTNTMSTLSEVTRTYDSFGNIKTETFDSGTVSSAISWNPTTKVMSETITLPSGKNIVETTLKGLPKTLEYDGSKLLQYNYGTGNVLNSIRKNFDLQDNHAAELSYTYNNWRKVSRRTEEFTAQNAPTVADYEYTYSKGLHLIGKQENEENRRTAYQYDSYYRLRRVDYDCAYSSSDPTCANGRNNVFKCNQSETDCEDFQLDGVHNIRASRENQTDFSWTVDGFNRLTQKSWNNDSITYTYDFNNNLVSEDFDGSNPPEIVYTYDKLNRLTSVTNSDYLVEYSYDPFNRRTEKTVYYTENSDTFERTHKYAYDGWDIISEEIKTVRTSDNPATTTTWQLRRYVDQGTDNHIIMDTVSCSDDGNGNCSPNESTLQRIWFHKDERGNVIAISDGNGTIYERYRYRVYGEHEVLNADFTPKTTAAVSPFLWGGSLYEPETNLYWMRNRYYHIDMHRFINQDPIGIWGDSNNLGNGFAYVAGMVIEASDPSGLEVELIYWHPVIDRDHKESIAGHISIRINDTSYSWESNGMNIDSIENYLNENTYRIGEGIILYMPADEELKLESYLKSLPQNISLGKYFMHDIFHRNPKGYWLTSNNCAQVALREISKATGYRFKLITLPEKAAREARNSPLNNGEQWYMPTQKDDKRTEVPQTGTQVNADPEDSATADFSRVVNWIHVVQNSDGSRTYTLANGDKVTVGHDGKIINCQGDCTQTPEGATFEEKYPSDPYEDTSDAIQKVLMSNILAKMLKRGESEQPPVFIDNSTGPNGAIMIFRNPYYINKDPLKNILILGYDGSKPIFVRNPLALPTSRTWSNTYERWQQSGFIQPEVDPWLR